MEVKNKPALNLNDYVHKKVVALEMFNRVKRSRNLAFVYIFSIIFIFGFISLHIMAGAGFAIISAIFMSVFLTKDIQYMDYLDKKYQLNIKNE